VWDKTTGKPLHNAIVWCDVRTADLCRELEKKHGSRDCFRASCGLPISTYFSAVKLRWLLDNVPAVSKAVLSFQTPNCPLLPCIVSMRPLQSFRILFASFPYSVHASCLWCMQVKDGIAMAGTVDSWIIWNLSGGPNGGTYATAASDYVVFQVLP
jgi:glycerol kinase